MKCRCHGETNGQGRPGQPAGRRDATLVEGVTYELPALVECFAANWLLIARQTPVPITLTIDDGGAVTGFEMEIEGYRIAFPTLTERPVISKL